jgi:DNA-binding beta-propeller fold protein YncE
MDVSRLDALRALAAIAEGATVRRTASGSDPADCVAAVLGDDLRRLSILGGREGLPRSLGSVLGSHVVRCLYGFRGVSSLVIPTPQIRWSNYGGLAVSRDGSTLLVSDISSAIHEFRVADGMHLRTIGSYGTGPLQFNSPWQLCISSDDFVFVADHFNDRVQVLTPRLDFHSFGGVGHLFRPAGVCADKDSVFVSESYDDRVSVFSRGDGALRLRFGSSGRGDGQLHYPCGLCFTGKSHHIAVADNENHRISVFTAKGEFVRHMGDDRLTYPSDVASSLGDDEIFVADYGNRRVAMFNGCGEFVKTLRLADEMGVSSVAVHGDAVFAQTHHAYHRRDASACVVST